MKKKNKFLIFLFSFLPGLGHFYAGLRERALIFFVLFIGAIFGVMGLSAIINSNDLIAVLGFALPVIWFVSLVDVFSLVDKKEGVKPENSEAGSGYYLENNRKLITVALSLIPGAGHMYLGLQKQGLQFMSLFFFTAFLMGWLNMSLFLFVLPIIWFYSLFDAYHRVEDNKVEKWNDGIPLLSWFSNNPKWTGWGLIITGCLVIFERILAPLIQWQVRNYLQTALVALVLIASGVRLLAGSKTAAVSAGAGNAKPAGTGTDAAAVTVEGKGGLDQCGSEE